MALNSASRQLKNRQAVKRGRQAEDIALKFLLANGYALEARNIKIGGGELDLVMLDQQVLVFVEVKGRQRALNSQPAAWQPLKTGACAVEETVGGLKKTRLSNAAEAYLAKRQKPWPVCRFDLVMVDLSAEPQVYRHLIDAFRPGD